MQAAVYVRKRKKKTKKKKQGKIRPSLLKTSDAAEEEDEVAANVVDYLSERGIKISDSDWHAIRDLIAGTLEEREEREEEVDAADSSEEELRKALKEFQRRNSTVSLEFHSSSGVSSSSKRSKASSPTRTAEPLLKMSHNKEEEEQATSKRPKCSV